MRVYATVRRLVDDVVQPQIIPPTVNSDEGT